jgi:peptidyl-prolyl cis-trans isomerase D
MFDSIRSHRRWLMLFLVALVFPSFVVTGIYSYNRMVGGEDVVAQVGDQQVLRQELDAAQREQMERLRGMFGAGFDPSMFDTPAARAATLQNLLSERALALEAERENLLIPADRVRQVISGQQAFQQDGKFNYERYQTLLRAQGLTEAAFEQRVRADLQKQALVQAVANSSIVPRTVDEQVRRLIEEERLVREIRFMPGEFRARLNVTDEQLKAFYESNQKDFRLPESARVEYVVLTLDDVAREVHVPESEARAYYEQNKARWGQDEQRKASHILFTAGEGGSAKDKAGARRQAEQVLAQLRASPREFEKLARQFSKDPGSAVNGGDLGQFGRNMIVKPFEEAAFKLQPGEISDLVESEFGFHIIRVDAVVPAQVKPFAQVRAEIEADLRRQAAQKKYAEAAEIFTNTVYEQADSLKPVADKLKLPVQVVEELTRAGMPPLPGAAQVFNARMIGAVFAEDSLKLKRNTEALEVGANALAAARVIEYRPERVQPLEQVRDQVRNRVLQEESSRLARAAAEKRLAELRAAASDSGFGPVRTVSRSKPEGLPQSALKVIMQAPANELPRYVVAELDGGAHALFQVQSARMPDKTDPTQTAELSRVLGQAFGAADDNAYLAALKVKHKARVLKPDYKAAIDEAKAAKKP